MMLHAAIMIPVCLPSSDPRVEMLDVAGSPDAALALAEPLAMDFASEIESLDAAVATLPQAGPPLRANRFTLKGGYYGASGDELDDGYVLTASGMRFLSENFAVEFELGYIDVDGSDSGRETEAWALPVMVNARLNVPIGPLDLYGGAGTGTFYFDAETERGPVSVDADGFLWAGNAFAGATINIKDAVALGLEYKYYFTEDISEFDSGLEGYALMLTLGFSK